MISMPRLNWLGSDWPTIPTRSPNWNFEASNEHLSPEVAAKPDPANQNASQEVVSCEASVVGMTGFEPATSASRTHQRCPETATNQAFLALPTLPLDHSLDRLDENVSAKRAEGGGRKAQKSKLKTPATTTAIPADDGNRRQPTTDFAQQVAGIMSLPLTDAERAECIRRLLAKQQKGC